LPKNNDPSEFSTPPRRLDIYCLNESAGVLQNEWPWQLESSKGTKGRPLKLSYLAHWSVLIDWVRALIMSSGERDWSWPCFFADCTTDAD